MVAAPRTTIWTAEPHTLAKHAILRGYLEAWFPILARWHGRLLYFDGFAGPGRYSKGEEGSPVIALSVAATHRAQLSSELEFIFVEKRLDRAQHLRDYEIPALGLPPHFKVDVRDGEFAPNLKAELDKRDEDGTHADATFAFVDPFGISGLPFSLIERLLSRPRCEVLVTFMTVTVRRFVDELREHVNDLIGNPRAADIIHASAEPVVEARRLYEESLRRRAKYVRFFQLRDASGQPIYDLFFATNHELGHEKMKEAMWGVDATGAYSFSDGVDPAQATLFGPTPGADLAPRLWQHFKGRRIPVDIVFSFVRETAYLEKHARDALRVLESRTLEGQQFIEVEPVKVGGGKRRPGSFPSGTMVRFSES
jgi:three-Cys-motif partner protein